MPARATKIRHDDETRAKIQAAQIINRLMGCINGEVELSPAQVSAAKTLLGKVLPDLSAVTLDGGLDNTVRVLSEKPISKDEWANEFADMGPATGTADSIN